MCVCVYMCMYVICIHKVFYLGYSYNLRSLSALRSDVYNNTYQSLLNTDFHVITSITLLIVSMITCEVLLS